MRVGFIAATLLVGSAALVAAAAQTDPSRPHSEPPAGDADRRGVGALSPESRQLFRQEMAGLQGAMLELLPSLIAGDWGRVTEIGERIEAGFVLARELTAEQREELHRVLPPDFLERDRAFHERASALVAAARNRQPEIATFYVYRLTEGCVDCHSRYAGERFPAFATPARAPAVHGH